MKVNTTRDKDIVQCLYENIKYLNDEKEIREYKVEQLHFKKRHRKEKQEEMSQEEIRELKELEKLEKQEKQDVKSKLDDN